MTETWHYADKGQPVGPFRLADLIAALQKIPGWQGVLVWRGGFSEWQRADRVPEILALTTPPMIPAHTVAASSARPPPLKASKRWPLAKILGGVAALAAAVVAGAFGKPVLQGAYGLVMHRPAPRAVEIETGYAASLAQLRAGLPKKIDEITTLTWVDYAGTKVIYENRLELDAARLDDAMKGKLHEAVTRTVCTTAEMRRVVDLGGSFRYVYTDIKSKPWMSFDIVSCT